MAGIRQANLLGQQRVDVVHLRAIEAASAADLDLTVGQILAGGNPFVIRGFNLIPGAATTPATKLQLQTAGGILAHPLATDSGTIFQTPANRPLETLNASNTRVQGSFTAGVSNYIGINLVRTADSTTADLVQFIDTTALTEVPKSVPLGRTLDYVITISNQAFGVTPGVAPLAIVVTDANNNIVTCQDARDGMYRLGSGGSVPNAQNVYAWPGGRAEVGDNSDFQVGDKVVGSTREWMQACMTRMWELGGGEHWYSATADRNVRMVRGYTGSPFTNGEWFEWTGTDLHWKSIEFVFDNSTASVNVVADRTANSTGVTDLADGQCIYVDLDRTTNHTSGNPLSAQKATLATLGTPVVPGSRFVMAYRVGATIFTRDSAFPVGATFTVATPTALGIVKLHQASLSPAAPVVVSDGDFNTATGVPQLTANTALVVTATGGGAAGATGTGNGAGAGVSGIGGSSGPGLLGQGTGVGPGADLTGGATGAALVTHGVASNDTPQALYKDSGGHVRSLLDHNGYPMGRRSEFREEWYAAARSNYSSGTTTDGILIDAASIPILAARWKAFHTVAGGGAQRIGVSDPTLTFAGRYATVDGFGDTPTTVCTLSTVMPLFFWQTTFLSVVLEFEIFGTSDANGELFVGLTDSPTALTQQGGSTSAVGVRKRAAETTWKSLTCNGTSEDVTDSTIAVNSTPVRVRIEVYGSGSLYGAKTTRTFFNEGVPIVQTAHFPSTSAAAYLCIANRNATGGSNNSVINVGPILMTWNRMLDLPAL